MSLKNNILLISHSSNISGGGEDDYLRLIKFLYGKYHIYAIFPEGPKVEEFKKYSDKFVVVPDKIFPIDCFSLSEYFIFIYRSIIKICRIIVFLEFNRDVNVAFVNSSVSFIEAFLLNLYKIPFVVSIKEKINPSFIRKIILRYYKNKAKKIIVISEYLKNIYIKDTKSKNVEIIYSSLDYDQYFNFKKTQTLNILSEKKFTVLNIGSFNKNKNQLFLLEALKSISCVNDFKVKMFGRVADKKYFKKVLNNIEKYNLFKIVELSDEISKIKMFRELYNCDCIVITSKEEGMSLVLLEGLFFEKPVISTPVGIVPDIINNLENGFIIPHDDSNKLSNILVELKNNKLLYNKIKKTEFETYCTHFDLNKSLKKYENTLLNAII